tara:strand:+ start:2496 stop:2672 length:177 start_codon:yes stop_codon:yes gene_type:complete
MTEQEAHKINDLYKQIDTLTAENTALKTAGSNGHSELVDLLKSVDTKIDKLTSKGVTK